jgi:hypothetical protein
LLALKNASATPLVELVVISPFSKKGYQSNGGDTRNYNNSYDEADILRLMAQGLGLPTSKLGWATKGTPMADFFSTKDKKRGFPSPSRLANRTWEKANKSATLCKCPARSEISRGCNDLLT